jgi:geranylgeranyl diphosphate synthase type II
MTTEFENYKVLVEEKLKSIFLALKKQIRNGDLPIILYDAMHYSVFNGGKRIRPILCLASYCSCLKTKDQFASDGPTTILPFACGIEFVHTFSLIQDDLPSMDNDDFRRGKPSLHRKYDEAIALLAADALFALAFQLFIQAQVDEKIKNRAISELARICGPSGLVAGQILDTMKQKQDIRSKKQKLIDKLKTAELIAGAMKIGAIVAEAEEKTINQIEKAGIYLGLLFQSTDDVIDKNQKSNIKYQKLQIKKYFERIKQISNDLSNEFRWIVDFSDYIRKRKT